MDDLTDLLPVAYRHENIEFRVTKRAYDYLNTGLDENIPDVKLLESLAHRWSNSNYIVRWMPTESDEVEVFTSGYRNICYSAFTFQGQKYVVTHTNTELGDDCIVYAPDGQNRIVNS